MGRPAVDPLTPKFHAALHRGESRYAIHEAGLARSIGPDDRQDLARSDLKGDVVDCGDCAVADCRPTYDERSTPQRAGLVSRVRQLQLDTLPGCCGQRRL